MTHRKIAMAVGIIALFVPLQAFADYWLGWRTLETVGQYTGATIHDALVFSKPTEMCGAIYRVAMSVSCSVDGVAVMIVVTGCSFSGPNGRAKVISQTDRGPLSEWSLKDFDGDKFIMMDVGDPPADFIKQLYGMTELQIEIDPVFGNPIAADFNEAGTEKAFSGIRGVCAWQPAVQLLNALTAIRPLRLEPQIESQSQFEGPLFLSGPIVLVPAANACNPPIDSIFRIRSTNLAVLTKVGFLRLAAISA